MVRVKGLAVAVAVAMLALPGTPVQAQQVAPVGMTAHFRRVLSPEPFTSFLVRVDEQQQAQGEPNRPRNAVIGGLVGAGLGVALGYGLALLGQAAYCEGEAQCSEYPRRAIRESTRAGFLIGGGIGALIGWHVN